MSTDRSQSGRRQIGRRCGRVPGSRTSRPRRLRAFGVLATTVLAAGVLGACSSSAAGPAKVDVYWSGASGARTVRVTWHEQAPLANRVSIQGVLTPSPNVIRDLPANSPNTLEFAAADFPLGGNYRIEVIGLTKGGSTAGNPAYSATFDALGPTPTAIEKAQIKPDGSVVVRWRNLPQKADFNPGDPLDVTAGPTTYTAFVGSSPYLSQAATPGPKTQVTLKVPPPFRFFVRTTNEWGNQAGARISGAAGDIAATFPRSTRYGTVTPVSGTVTATRLDCTGSGCRSKTAPAAGIRVVVQAQFRPDAPWVLAGQSVSNPKGQWKAQIRTNASALYRAIAMPNSTAAGKGVIVFGSVTPGTAVPTSVIASIAAQPDTPQGTQVGKRSRIRVTLRPAIDASVSILEFNGQRWSKIGNLKIEKGTGEGAVLARKAGYVAYQAVVPDLKYADGKYSLAGITSNRVVIKATPKPKPKPPPRRSVTPPNRNPQTAQDRTRPPGQQNPPRPPGR